MTLRPAITPYWNCFGSFFRYPLAAEPLMMCVLFGVLAGGSGVLFPPLNLLAFLGVFVASLRHAYKVLELTARGHLDAAGATVESVHGGKYLPYKQLFVILLGITLCAFAAGIGGPHFALLLFALFALLLPASIMILAVTNDLGQAITPSRLLGLMRSIGLPYLGLCACLFLLSASNGAVINLLAPKVHRGLLGGLAGLVGSYFLLVMFRLMGYALYQYHRVVGIDVDLGFDEQTGEGIALDPEQLRAEAIGLALREGRFQEGIRLAQEAVTATPDSFAANQRLHRLLLAIPGETAAMARHAQGWLRQLLTVGQAREALEILQTLWKHQPGWLPDAPEMILPLAQAAFDTRRYPLSRRLLKGFDQRFPDHTDIPAIYVLGAHLLIEHQRDEAQARRVLEAVCRYFPQHPARQEADKLLQVLERLATVGIAGGMAVVKAGH